jgi:hypothetical protein
MKTIKHYVNWFNELNRDEKETLAGGLVAVLCILFLTWLTSTNSYPVLDAKTTDTQIHQQKTYELKPSFDKYVNHVYNSKYSK